MALSKVLLRKCFPFFSKVLLHCGIDGQFFRDCMASEIPGEHVALLYFFVFCRSGFEMLVALVEAAVVCAEGF